MARWSPAEVARSYWAKSGNKSAWFDRRMKELTPDERDEVHKIMEAEGILAKQPRPQVKKKVELAEEDKDAVINSVWERWLRRPDKSVQQLANQALSQIPGLRGRRLRGRELEEICAALADRIEQGQRAVEDANRLRTLPSRDEILATLPEEEMNRLYRERVLNGMSPAELLARVPLESVLQSIPTPTFLGRPWSGSAISLPPRLRPRWTLWTPSGNASTGCRSSSRSQSLIFPRGGMWNRTVAES